MTMTIAEAAAELAVRLNTDVLLEGIDLPEPSEKSSAEFHLSMARMMQMDDLKESLLTLAANGVLRVRRCNGGYLPQGTEVSESSHVDVLEAQTALEGNGEKFEVLLSGAPESSPLPVTAAAPATPVQRQHFQEAEILRVISTLGYSAQSLPKPPPGTKGVKSTVRAALKFTAGVFDKAWQRLRDTGEIKENT